MINVEQTPYKIIGGDESVRQLVVTFYELMDTLPGLQALRDLHPEDLSGSIDKLYKFLSGWLGGPSLYTDEYGHPKLRARHMPFAIDAIQRDQWLYCMFKAMEKADIDVTVQQHLQQAFTKTADHMINR